MLHVGDGLLQSHTGYYCVAKTVLDTGFHPTGLAQNDDEPIALRTMKQPWFVKRPRGVILGEL
jgi:hypothetical protein